MVTEWRTASNVPQRCQRTSGEWAEVRGGEGHAESHGEVGAAAASDAIVGGLDASEGLQSQQ